MLIATVQYAGIIITLVWFSSSTLTNGVFKWKIKAWKNTKGKYNVSSTFILFIMLHEQHFILYVECNGMLFKNIYGLDIFSWIFNCHSNRKIMGSWEARVFSYDSLYK